MDNEKLTKLRALLLSAWSDGRAHTSRFDPATREPYQILVDRDGVGFVIGESGMECLNEATDLLVEDDLLGERFSRSKLSAELQSLLLMMKDNEPTKIEQEMSQATADLIGRLEKTPVIQWRVSIPVKNLILKIPSLEIGKVRLEKFDKSKCDEILKEIGKLNESSTSPEPVKKQVMQMVTDLVSKTYLGCNVATATIEAADDSQAQSLAEGEIEHALNVLRLYGLLGNNTRMRQVFVGLEGTIFQGRHTALSLAADRYFLPWKTTGYLFEYEIDTNTLTLMNKYSLQTLSEILRKGAKERTNFEQLLVTAIDFYGQGMNEPSPRNAYVSLFISLESLLLKTGEPRSLLAERVALVVGTDEKTRASLFERTGRAYRMRSQIVHNGFDDVTENDVLQVTIIGFQVITRLIPVITQMNDIGQLITMCQKSKFGGPVFGV
jgi:hypothetical protein